MARQKYHSLEVLRAVCALAVLANHVYAKTAGFPQHPIANMLFAFATEAVICFFVLSGCVISLQKYESAVQYAKARFFRIVPIYYVSLFATVLSMSYCNQPVALDQLIKNALFLQDLQGHIASPLAFNLPAWSLSYEVIYYAIFGVALYVPRLLWFMFFLSVGAGLSSYFGVVGLGWVGFVQSIFSLFCCWLVGVGVVGSFKGGGRWLSLETGAFLFCTGLVLSRVSISSDYYDFARLFAFAVGSGALCSSLLGAEVLNEDVSRLPVAWGLGVWERAAICICALVALWLLSRSLWATKSVLTAVVVLAAIAPSIPVRVVRCVVGSIEGWLMYVGGLSYALYIIHYPIIYFANTVLESHGPVGRVLFVVVLSLASAHILEYWFQAGIKAFIRRRPSLSH